MYLTRIPLNQRRAGAQKLLLSREALHAAVESLFPPVLDDTVRGRNLWRLDRSADTAMLYIVSDAKPDPISITEQAGWPGAEHPAETVEYSHALSKLAAGQHNFFRTTVNPTRSESRPGQRGTQRPIHGEDNQVTWLCAKAERAGFTINPDTIRVLASGKDTFPRKGGSVSLQLLTITGLLTITDPEQFSTTLTTGIGRGKAYGAGLITIAAA